MTNHLIPAADLAKIREALQSIPNLIKHQYTGSREAMSDLQHASNDAEEALALLDNLQEVEVVGKTYSYEMGTQVDCELNDKAKPDVSVYAIKETK